MMIEVFDTAAARQALQRGKLDCPGCGQLLRPWGHARPRAVRDADDLAAMFVPDRARCGGCRVSHVILDARLLPRRAYAAGLIGAALAASALGSGCRPIAAGLGVPHGTARDWIRRARRSAEQLRVTGIKAVVSLDQDELPTRVFTDELAGALNVLAAAAVVMGRRFRWLQRFSVWARITVITGGRLLTMARAG